MTAARTVRYAVQFAAVPAVGVEPLWQTAVAFPTRAAAAERMSRYIRDLGTDRRWRLVRITEHTDVIEAPAENYSQDLAVAPADSWPSHDR